MQICTYPANTLYTLCRYNAMIKIIYSRVSLKLLISSPQFPRGLLHIWSSLAYIHSPHRPHRHLAQCSGYIFHYFNNARVHNTHYYVNGNNNNILLSLHGYLYTEFLVHCADETAALFLPVSRAVLAQHIKGFETTECAA